MKTCPTAFRQGVATSRRPLPVLRVVSQWFLVLGLAVSWTLQAADGPKQFATPDEAVAALLAAVKALDRDAVHAILGPETGEVANPDQVQATNEFSAFAAAFEQGHRLVRESDSRCLLRVGSQGWPFPIPMVHNQGRWYFDVVAGREELLNRRIGRNELAVLEALRACVAAQREYASRDWDGDEVLEYAQRIMSTPGRQDGLYWSPELGADLSPLGPLVANAQHEGYAMRHKDPTEAPEPFNGYLFRILTRQGKHAPGGAYDYLINGNMIGGFAVLAWPAAYGDSGVMTFIVSHQGRVLQKNLGHDTARKVAKMKAYDPDASWQVSPD
jgi:hypothetical protein